MHQLILTRASRNADVLAETELRLIRSSSSSLPPTVMAELEETFEAPVIESYGMTEAAHQMSSNPLPPLERKPGSVGLPAGPEIAIMDEDGALLAMGQRRRGRHSRRQRHRRLSQQSRRPTPPPTPEAGFPHRRSGSPRQRWLPDDYGPA